MKIVRSAMAVLFLTLACCATAMAQDAKPKPSVLITNARIFDGEHAALATGMSVLVDGNKIAKIAKSISGPAGATVIDANGNVLMPGLIDAHWHIYYVFWPLSRVASSDFGTLTLAAAKAHKETLMRGFTTVRDAGVAGYHDREGRGLGPDRRFPRVPCGPAHQPDLGPRRLPRLAHDSRREGRAAGLPPEDRTRLGSPMAFRK